MNRNRNIYHCSSQAAASPGLLRVMDSDETALMADIFRSLMVCTVCTTQDPMQEKITKKHSTACKPTHRPIKVAATLASSPCKSHCDVCDQCTPVGAKMKTPSSQLQPLVI